MPEKEHFGHVRKIGIVAALPGELKPLTTGWNRQGDVHRGRLGDVECFAAAAGIGAAAASRACEMVLAGNDLDAVVSLGWAGALSGDLEPGRAYAVAEVVDSTTGQRHRTASPAGLRLVTTDHTVRRDEKPRLREHHQADLADMEAATVAGIADTRGTAFFCFKAVSDEADDNLPDFDRFVDPDGRMRMTAFAAHALSHPGCWAPLVRFARNSKAAADDLARLVTKTFNG